MGTLRLLCVSTASTGKREAPGVLLTPPPVAEPGPRSCQPSTGLNLRTWMSAPVVPALQATIGRLSRPTVRPSAPPNGPAVVGRKMAPVAAAVPTGSQALALDEKRRTWMVRVPPTAASHAAYGTPSSPTARRGDTSIEPDGPPPLIPVLVAAPAPSAAHVVGDHRRAWTSAKLLLDAALPVT